MYLASGHYDDETAYHKRTAKASWEGLFLRSFRRLDTAFRWFFPHSFDSFFQLVLSHSWCFLSFSFVTQLYRFSLFLRTNMASHRALRALTKGANMLSGAASSSRLAAPLLRSTAVGFMRLASQPTVSARFYTSERARQHEAKVKKIEAVEQVAEMVEEAEAVLEEEYAIPTVLELATSESHTHNEDAVGKLFEMSPQLIDNLLPESASAAFAKEWKDIHDCVEDTSRGRAFVVTEGLHGLRKKILDSYNANSPLRILVRGQFGVGKSSALAATALACRQAERCVVYIPSAKELIDGSSIIMDMQ